MGFVTTMYWDKDKNTYVLRNRDNLAKWAMVNVNGIAVQPDRPEQEQPEPPMEPASDEELYALLFGTPEGKAI